MNGYAVMKAAREWYLNPSRGAWAREATAADLQAEAGFTPQEAEAVASRRVDALHAMGVHPMTLIQLSRVLGFPLDERWRELTG